MATPSPISFRPTSTQAPRRFSETPGPGTLLHEANLSTADEPSGATCADFNNDGRVDAAVSSWKDKTVTLYLRQEDESFLPGGTSPVGNLPRSVSAADLNLDGNMDLVVVNVQSSDLTLLFGNGQAAFPRPATFGSRDSRPKQVDPFPLRSPTSMVTTFRTSS